MSNEQLEKYRFVHGSLYVWRKEQNGYVHCFRRAGVNSKASAIRAYEAEPMEVK